MTRPGEWWRSGIRPRISAVVAGAAGAGARLSTHLGNGLPQVLPKLDNTLFAQLAEDRLHASFIADGIHLPPPALKAMLRAKGLDRSILVTDAVSAAGTTPGVYPFAGMSVEHAEDGSVRLPGSRLLAGSALTLDRAVRNLVEWGIATPEQALAAGVRQPRAGSWAPLSTRSRSESEAGEVEWSPDLAVREVRLGDRQWRFANGGVMRKLRRRCDRRGRTSPTEGEGDERSWDVRMNRRRLIGGAAGLAALKADGRPGAGSCRGRNRRSRSTSSTWAARSP